MAKSTTTKQPIYTSIDQAFAGGLLPGGAKPAGAKDPQVEADKQAQASCRAQGGQWDPSTRSCIMPKPEPPKPQVSEVPKEQDNIFRNEQGNISGVTMGGKTYLGLGPKDVENMLKAKQEKQQGGPATQAFETGAVASQQAATQQAISQQAIADLGLSPTQIQAIQSGLVEAPIDYQQALTAGAANIIPSAIGGALGGAAVGAVGTGGAASVPLAVAGGIGGLVTGLFKGVMSNIKKQQSGNISASQDVLTNAKTNMKRLSSIAAKDPSNAAMYVEAYNMQLAQVYKAQAQIKLETNGNLNKFMEDGTDILSDFDLFLQPNGQAEIYRRQLELSLISGVAPSLTVDDFADE